MNRHVAETTRSTPSLASTLLEDDSPIATVDDVELTDQRCGRAGALLHECHVKAIDFSKGRLYFNDRTTNRPVSDRTRDRCRRS